MMTTPISVVTNYMDLWQNKALKTIREKKSALAHSAIEISLYSL